MLLRQSGGHEFAAERFAGEVARHNEGRETGRSKRAPAFLCVSRQAAEGVHDEEAESALWSHCSNRAVITKKRWRSHVRPLLRAHGVNQVIIDDRTKE